MVKMSLGGSSPSAPAAPDPNTTAQAQTQSNKETAQYNFGLNNPNYNTPYGNLTYNQTQKGATYDQAAYDKALATWQQAQQAQQSASQPIRGRGGYIFPAGYNQSAQAASTPMPTLDQFKLSDAGNPQVTANVTLAPAQQALLDANNKQSLGLADTGNQLLSQVQKSILSQQPTPQDINSLTQQGRDAYYKQQTALLDPQYQKMQAQQNAQLANQGITAGSEAYNNAQSELGRQRDYAYGQAQNNAITQAPQYAQSLFALNSQQQLQPLNELNALRSGSQVTMPQLPQQTPTTMAGTNTAGIANQAYQNQLGLYNSQVGQNSSSMNGLMSLGGSLGAAAIMASDRRLKKNIRKIGKTPSGFNVYEFEYKSGGGKQTGVMAQEIEKIIPNAVITMPNGYKTVNYAMVV